MSKKNCLRKRRYEYYKGTTEIMDNGANELVEDVVNVLNQKDYNIIELIKIKQFQAQRIADLEAKLAESESKRKSLEEKVKFLTEETEENFVDGQKYNELKQQLAEKDKEIEKLKKEIKEPEEIWNANLAELKEEVKQKLAQEFTEKIDGMLKEKVKEKTIDLNNQIRLMQESQQIEIDKRQREVNSYLKVIKAYNSNENLKAIEQLEKVKEKFGYKHNSQLVISSKNLVGFIDQQINELKGEVKDVKD